MNGQGVVLVFVLVCASGLDKQEVYRSDGVNSHSFIHQTFEPSVSVGGQIKQFRYEDKVKDFRLIGDVKKVPQYQVYEDEQITGEKFDSNRVVKDQGGKGRRFGSRNLGKNVINKQEDFGRGRFETELEDLKMFGYNLPKKPQSWDETEPKHQSFRLIQSPKSYQFTQKYEDFSELKPQKLQQNYVKFPHQTSSTKSRLEYLHEQRHKALQQSLNLQHSQQFPSDSVHSFHGLYQSHGSGNRPVKNSLLPHPEDDVEGIVWQK